MAIEKLDGRDYRIILAFADSGMNIAETAFVVYMNRGTVIYHMEKIKRITGLDPRNFYDLYKLVSMVKGVVDDGQAQNVRDE